MTYIARDYSNLSKIKGFSEAMLQNHFTLYHGYVTNVNKLMESLDTLLKEGNASRPEYAEMKRRLGWEFNGMRLHELYFENMGGAEKSAPDSNLLEKLTAAFGSREAWETDFRGTGAMRGIGWVGLYLDKTNGRLMNVWINEHDVGHPTGCIPLLIMDVFEHAYMLDYGLKRALYIDAFFDAINWAVVSSRLS
ncbi:MAG: superoxide dismutase [Pelobacteraceae bacterium]